MSARQNEAHQQTRPAFTTIAPALAAEPWWSADLLPSVACSLPAAP